MNSNISFTKKQLNSPWGYFLVLSSSEWQCFLSCQVDTNKSLPFTIQPFPFGGSECTTCPGFSLNPVEKECAHLGSSSTPRYCGKCFGTYSKPPGYSLDENLLVFVPKKTSEQHQSPITWKLSIWTHLKNMLVKMGSSSPRFGVKIKHYWNHPAIIGILDPYI